MTRAIIYARVSTDAQRETNFSIPDQIRACANYIASKGYLLVGDAFINPKTGAEMLNQPGAIAAYVDDFSGESYPRPALDLALDYYDRVGFDVMVVAHRDRLTRDNLVTYQIRFDFCEQRQIQIDIIEGAKFDDSSSGVFMSGIEDVIKKYENAERARRSVNGKLHKARERKLFVGAGRVPYGYQYDPAAPGGLAIDPGPAEVVQYIFDQYYSENVSIRGIAHVLTETGAIPHDGGAEWNESSVSTILRNTAYKGVVYYNKVKTSKNTAGQRIVKDRDPSEWIPIEVTQLVSVELFDAVQEKLQHNREVSRRKPSRFYLLSGLIVCEICKRPYTSATKKPLAKYRYKRERTYYTHKKRAGHCRNRDISARTLEPRVWNTVIELLNNPAKLRNGYDEARAMEDQEQARNRALLDDLNRQVEKVDRRRLRLQSMYTDPEFEMTKSEYLAQKRLLDEELSGYLRRIDEIASQLSNLPTREEFEEFETFAILVRDRLTGESIEPTPQNMRAILEMLRATVRIGQDNDDIWLEGWFGSKKLASGLLSNTSRCHEQNRGYFRVRVL